MITVAVGVVDSTGTVVVVGTNSVVVVITSGSGVG